jgi:diguanylate cyclase (GGDEF)-like protein
LASAAVLDQLIGKRFDQLIDAEQRDMIENAVMNESSRVDAGIKTEIVLGGKMVRLDGGKIDIELAAVPFRMRGKHDVLLVARDISERKKAEQKIQYLAYHDTLTGLGNRLLFKERLEHTISLAERSRKKLAILFIDLNRFKRINDTSGHFIGDQILKECAQRLIACLRESDTVARSGGDEFLVLIESASHSLDIPHVARKILSALRFPFNAGGKSFSIDASIGISSFPADGTDAETLIKHADTAM